MAQWTATLEELREDLALMQAAHQGCGSVETSARVAFQDGTQDALKVLIPAPRFVAGLMAGGFFKRKRCIGACEETGLPIFEGANELLPAMTHDEAIAFIAWRDLPPGCNHFQILNTDDLPRIGGSIDAARKFRAAWRLEEAA